MEKVSLTIDNLVVVVSKGTTILQAALDNSIYIPHLCYHPDLDPSGVCRLCMVEVDGQVVFSCLKRVEEGIVVKTRTHEIDRIRRTNIELLVANNHLSCQGCSASGHCALQKARSYIHVDRQRLLELNPPKEDLPIDNANPFLIYNPNKCVSCEICVRTCQGIQSAIHIVGRGYKVKVAFFGRSSLCESCRECVLRCPVGALTAKDDTPLPETCQSHDYLDVNNNYEKN